MKSKWSLLMCAAMFVFVAFTMFGIPGMVWADTVEVQVSSGNDDAEEKHNGEMENLDQNVLNIKKPGINPSWWVGVRFQNVTIPQGAEIVSAYLRFQAARDDSGASSFTIYGQDHDDAPAFSSSNNDITGAGRSPVAAAAPWNAGDWVQDDWYDTPEIKTIVQAIVDRPGWQDGNAMVFAVKGGGQEKRARSHDKGADRAAKLIVEYNTGATPTYTVTFQADGDGSLQGVTSQVVEQGGSTTAVTAEPDSGYEFEEWTGGVASTDNPLTITNVTENMTVTANFVEETTTTTTTTTSTTSTSTTTTSTSSTTSSTGPTTTTTTTLPAGSVCLDIAEYPLDAEFVSAPPNIMFLLDDSGSMDFQTMTTEGQDGSFQGYEYIMDDTGDNTYSGPDRMMPTRMRALWKSQWKEKNTIYYNPSVTYDPWPTMSDADLDYPKSNPIASNTYSLDDTYLTLYSGNIPKIVLIHEDENDDNSVADAIKLQPLDENDAPVGDAIWVDNKNESAFYTTGDWGESGAVDEYNNGSKISDDKDATATWELLYIPSGKYEVSVWTSSTRDDGSCMDRNPAAKFTVYHKNGQNAHTVDQDRCANGDDELEVLGNYTFDTFLPSFEQSIVLTHDADGDGEESIADAIKLVPTTGGGDPIWIDDQDDRCVLSGSWGTSGAVDGWPNPDAWVNGKTRITEDVGATATWNIVDIPGGTYDVYVYSGSTQDNGNCYTRNKNAQFTIKDANGTTTPPVSVNQSNCEEHCNGCGDELTMAQRLDHLGQFTFERGPLYDQIDIKEILNAHYYTWMDANDDGVMDSGEIYLVELGKTGGSYSWTFSQFTDADGNDWVDYDELTEIQTPTPANAPIPATTDDEGYLTARTPTEERQNFANWYQYYHKRELAAKAAVAKSIVGMEGVSIGISTIHNRINQSVLPVKLGLYGDDTSTLLNLLFNNYNSSGGTPLRQGMIDAGQYFDNRDGAGDGGIGSAPYALYGDEGAECQQNYLIAMTDGFYNGDVDNNAPGNADGDDSTDFDGGTDGPFGDSYGADSDDTTLADIAMEYYENDLAPDLLDSVNDEAAHQHMVTYTVAFGVEGTIDRSLWGNCPSKDVNGDWDPASCPDWPSIDQAEEKIDDMWHAAVNGRGLFLSAADPEKLAQALATITQDIDIRRRSGAAVSINSQRLEEDTTLYQAIFKSDAWSGDLQAWAVHQGTGALADEPTWSAAEVLNDRDLDADPRSLFTYDGSAGISFAWDSLTAAQQNQLDNDETILDFLAGDRSNEGTFRTRETPLGDIVHSSPLHVGNTIYVGANDGMLHAFDDQTGAERFAYVPNLIFGKLKNLAYTPYAHTYFVDMPPYAKAMTTTNQTLLVGGLGGGGRGYFCLDISDPANFAESHVLWEYSSAADDDIGYSFSRAFIAGSQYGDVVIFGNGYDSVNAEAVLYVLDATDGSLVKKISTGVGNPSTLCNGLSTPALIDVEDGDGNAAPDGKVDYVYAGDLQGNLWKFDLTDPDPANWVAAYGENPLFQAKNSSGQAQPITSMPNVMRHCDKKGYIVVFGTGKYIEETDPDNQEVQAIYGIWDWADEWEEALDGAGTPDPDSKYLGSLTSTTGSTNCGDGYPALGEAPRTLSHQTGIYLSEQTAVVDVDTGDFRVLSVNPVNWASIGEDSGVVKVTDGCHAGWYFDLTQTGERVISPVTIRGGKAIIITSIPSNTACSTKAGDSVLMALNACTGSSPTAPVLDTPTETDDVTGELVADGQLTDADLVDIDGDGVGDYAPGMKINDMIYSPAILSMGDGERDMAYFGKARPGAGSGDSPVESVVMTGLRRGMYFWRELD